MLAIMCHLGIKTRSISVGHSRVRRMNIGHWVDENRLTNRFIFSVFCRLPLNSTAHSGWNRPRTRILTSRKSARTTTTCCKPNMKSKVYIKIGLTFIVPKFRNIPWCLIIPFPNIFHRILKLSCASVELMNKSYFSNTFANECSKPEIQ